MSKEMLQSRFELELSPGILFEANLRIKQGDSILAVVWEGWRMFGMLKWGFRSGYEAGNSTHYFARAEGKYNRGNLPAYKGIKGIYSDKRFMKAIRQNRCIVPVSAVIIRNKTGIPCVLYRETDRMMMAAGIWNISRNETGHEKSCALITVPANSIFREMGQDRMPLFLEEKQMHKWLRSEHLNEISGMMHTPDSQGLNAYPVSAKYLDEDSAITDKSVLLPVGKQLMNVPREDYHFPRSGYAFGRMNRHW